MNRSDCLRTPVLITGAKGMLGSDLLELLSEEVGADQVFGTDLLELDITSGAAVREFVVRSKPKTIINAAAYTDVDKAETERDKAYTLNVVGPEQLSAVSREVGIKLFHFSTDHVFDGNQDRPWTEGDEPHPANYYAQTKLWGERPVLDLPGGLVLRIQWLYGRQKNRFTTLRQKRSFTPFSDQFGAPTSTRKVSQIVIELLKRDAGGIFHFAYDDHASWAEVFQFVKDELQLETELYPTSTDSVTLPARRPKFSVLSNEKLRDFLGVSRIGSWKEDLGTFLRENG